MLSDDLKVYFFLDTKNVLTEEVGGYEHVTVLRNIKVVDEDLVDALQNLPRGSVPGDCILCNCRRIGVGCNPFLSNCLSSFKILMPLY